MSLNALHELLLQAPLSQLNSVLADLRGLLSDPDSTGCNPRLLKDFEASLPELLQKFHEQQGKVIRLPGMEDGSLVAEEARPAGTSTGEYQDEERSKQFIVDHVNAKATSSETYKVQDKDELREELTRFLTVYLKDHYPELDKARTNEGASGGVWRSPLRKVVKSQKPAISKKTSPLPTSSTATEDTSAGAQDESEVKDTAMAPPNEEGDNEEAAEESEKAGEAAVPSSDDATMASSSTSEGDAKAPEAVVEPQVGEEEEDEDEGELVEVSESGDGEAGEYVLKIVSGKSNPNSFWSGRWLSTYRFKPSDSLLACHIKLQIHYYENGNVQLNSTHTASLPLASGGSNSSSDPTSLAKRVVSTIKKHESEYQERLDSTYESLNEKAFKALRRQLPVTRQKVDWDKVLNYRLGSDLAGAQGAR